jgi:hypothetical protein
MGIYRLETILSKDSPSRFVIHEVGDEETQWIVSCESLIWAKQVKKALEWLDTFDNGRMSIPAPPRQRAKKAPVKRCVKKRS